MSAETNIPPEREADYLINAEEAAYEAATPVVKGLGRLMIDSAEGIIPEETAMLLHDAEQLTKADAAAAEMAEAAVQYAHDNDYRLEGTSTGIGDMADTFNRIEAQGMKSGDYRELLHKAKPAPLAGKAGLYRRPPAAKTDYGVGVNLHISPNEANILEDGSELDK